MKLKRIPLLLSAALILFCLTGCGTEETVSDTPEETPETVEEAPAVESAVPAEEDTAAESAEPMDVDFQAAYETYAPEDVVMTVNGLPVTWAEYYAWIYQAASQIYQYFGVSDWNAAFDSAAEVLEDPTYGNYVLSYAYNNAMQCAVISSKAEEAGITLTEDQRAEVDATMASYASQFGGEEALEEYLSTVYTSSDFLRDQTELAGLFTNLYDSYCDEYGETLSDAEALAYVKDQGYLYAKHILFKTVDDEYASLGEETVAQKKADAEYVLAQLQACTPEELPEVFQSLMLEYSEDPGAASYPDGYYFQSGEFVAEFEEAVLGLEENGLSGLVESDYGYHIIYCPPMSVEHVIDYDTNGEPYGARDLATAALFDAMAGEWYSAADVVWSGDYASLDLNELLGKGNG